MNIKLLLIFALLLPLLAAGCAQNAYSPETTAAAETDIYETTKTEFIETAAAAGSESETQQKHENMAFPNELLNNIRENMPVTDGSTSTIPIETAIRAAVLGISQEEAETQVSYTKTYESLRNLVSGKCSLIFRTPMSDKERSYLKESNFSYAEEPIAGEGFVFVVNKNNPVDTLTIEQLKEIYSGKITNWSEVGGADLPITAYQRNADSGSQNYMISFMGDTPLMKPVTEELPATMTGILNAVANYENSDGAIGYSVYAYSEGMYEDMIKIKHIKVNGVEPTFENMADGSYPLLGFNYAVFSSDEPEDSTVRALVKWIQSDAGQRVIAAAGYVPYRNVEGLTMPEHGGSSLCNGLGTGADASPDADYRYIMPWLYEMPLTVNEEVNKILTMYVESENKRLSEIDATEYEGFVRRRSIYASLYSDPVFQYSVVNGYLSILSGFRYDLGFQDSPVFWYEANGAVFDLYTGKKLDFTDLFPSGSDFLPQLNGFLSNEASKPYSGFGATYDMVRDYSGLREGEFTFTADSIVFFPGNIFADGVCIDTSELYPIMSVGTPRDMKEIFDSEKLSESDMYVTKEVVTRYNDDIGRALQFPNGNYTKDMPLSDLTIWILDEEKSGLSAESVAKINNFILGTYENHFSSGKTAELIEKNGYALDDVVEYGLEQWPDFTINLCGSRFVCFTGVNTLAFNTESGESYELTVIQQDGSRADNEREAYNVSFYLNAKTGELLSPNDIFIDGWYKNAVFYERNLDLFSSDERSASAPASVFENGVGLSECNVTFLQNYGMPYRNSPDGEIEVNMKFIAPDGTVFTAFVPADQIL